MRLSKEEALQFCSSTQYGGSMGTFEVKAVRQFIGRATYSSLDVELNDKIQMSVTPLHAFRVVRDGEELCVRADELHEGDKVWVDIHAFALDGSLYRR